MRRMVRMILAAAALLAAGMILTSFVHRGRTVLYRRHAADGAYQFLVADHGTLIVARQKLESLITAGDADASEFGKLQMKFGPINAPGIHADFGTMTLEPFPVTSPPHGFFSFEFGPVVLGNGSTRTEVRATGAPMWAIGAVLLLPWALLTARAAWSHTRRVRRRRAGLCAGCGYDLRASAEFCPECGGANPGWRSTVTPT
jgi:hypothetical protein